jgi:hypothetical protein
MRAFVRVPLAWPSRRSTRDEWTASSTAGTLFAMIKGLQLSVTSIGTGTTQPAHTCANERPEP